MKSTFINITILLLTVLILEVIAGFTYNLTTPKNGRKIVADLLENKEQVIKSETMPHPYTLYTNTPNYISPKGIKQHNFYGHRSSEISQDKEDGTIRILTLGGSTTYGYLLDYPQDAWPMQLGKILEKKTGRKVEVMNGGLNYGTTAELLNQYMIRDRFFEADYVILHTGGNDAVPLIVDGYKSDYSHFRKHQTAKTKLRPGEFFLLKSHIIKTFYAWWLSAYEDRLILEPAGFWDTTQEEKIFFAKRTKPIGFKRNIEGLVRNIKADNATPILFPFYMAEEKIFTMPEPYKYAKPTYKATMIGLGKNIEVMKNLARKHDALYDKLPEKTIPLKYFFDHCHLKKEGEAIKANFMAKIILKDLKSKKH